VTDALAYPTAPDVRIPRRSVPRAGHRRRPPDRPQKAATFWPTPRITRERDRAALRFARDRDLRHAIAEAVFEQIDVLEVIDFTFTLTAHAKARGWDAAFGAGDQSISIGRSGRGERSQTSGTDLGVPVTWPLPLVVVRPRQAIDLIPA
jgi:hypothetical protein